MPPWLNQCADLGCSDLGAALLAGGCALSAFAQVSAAYYKFTPSVIRSTETQNVLFEARITGTPTRVALDFNPVGGRPLLDLLDDGTNGDRQAGDGIYSVTLTPAQVLQGLRTDDVFRRFLGLLRLYQGTTVSASYNVFVSIHTPELPVVVVKQLATDLQYTASVVNIYDPGFFNATGNLDLNRISRRFYQSFRDEYDMINIVVALNYIQNRFHFAVKRNVQGIGLPVGDFGFPTGSGRRLLGFNVFPNTGFFDGADVGYVHEIGHQWIQFMQIAPFTSGIPHWPISSLASGIMGFSIPPAGEGGDYNCKVVPEAGGVRLQANTTPKTHTDFGKFHLPDDSS